MESSVDGGGPPKEEHWPLRVAPWVMLLLLIAFIASTISMQAPESQAHDWKRPASLGALLLATAIWFISCFTGDAQAKLKHGFIFAYAFTFGAFALLLTPFMGSYDEPVESSKPAVRPPEGVLQLVRGCVAGSVDGMSAQVSAVTRCPNPSWVTWPGDKRPAERTVAAVARDSVQDPARRFDELTPQFTWLVSVGGVTVRKYRPAATLQGEPPAQGFVEIYGGLAVPFFVIVLAFIGGAVSLSRRIPEYQRRSEPGYVPTEREPAMKAFQAREHVVFQIMQLTSAPFLAMATWYVVSPSTVASAACLAFGTGFASEPLLLMIRGMVEGIRPEGARLKAPPPDDQGK